ncbi:MAG: hypothetical protein JWQ19_3965 [Subtercola sp.]|nr:hypothetical protein [Subtercola sp.]
MLHEPTAAEDPPSSGDQKVIGRPSLGLLIVVWAAIVLSFAFCWGGLAQPPNDPSNIVPIGLVIGTAVAAWYLLGTARVVVRQGTVELVGWAAAYQVPFDQIHAASAEAGFQLVLVSGRRVGTIALGDSLIGQVTGQRRANRVAHRLQELTGIGTAIDPQTWHQDSVTARPRFRAISHALALITLLVGGTVLINALAG